MGIKLELTHACNLRCDFCYTDSPRHTLARTSDLDDARWERVAADVLALEIPEVVVTGGEPLLRAPLALGLLERLAAARVRVSMPTNGWFVEAAAADRLAAIPGLVVHISVDGATPELHDAARGVPGSWRRATRALSLLLERGVEVSATHVVTPLNRRWVAELFETMAALGLGPVALTAVVPVGAAARHGDWTVDRHELRRLAASARARHPGLAAYVQPGTGSSAADPLRRAPGGLLVRPSGAVLTDSLRPFRFGHVDDGLATCWERVRAAWRHPDIGRWARGVASTRAFPRASAIPYVDPEVAPGERRLAGPRSLEDVRLPPRTTSSTVPAEGPGDVAGAREHVRALAAARA